METNTLLVILICICYLGFGGHYLMIVAKDYLTIKEKNLSILSRIITFFFWWIMPIIIIFVPLKDKDL